MHKIIRIYKPDPRGYVRCFINHRTPYLHRANMELHLKRKLKRHEIVHHKNDNPSDNRISNLELHPNQKSHFSKHRIPQIKFKFHCKSCGKEILLKLSDLKNRRSKGAIQHFCSRKCFHKNLTGKSFSGNPHRWPKGHFFSNRKKGLWIKKTKQRVVATV